MFKKFDNYDGVCFFNGLIFYAPVALLIRTQAGVSNATFFMLQALLSLAVFVGEIPTGFITDKIGYKKSIISAQIIMLLSRIILLLAFVFHSIWLFVLEAVMEGIGGCLSSGTCEAYIYSTYGETAFARKSAHSANYGTIGFIISTITYVFIYQYFDMDGLLISTIVSGILAVLFAIGLDECNEKSPCETGDKNPSLETGNITALFKNNNSRGIMLTLSIFSVIWILINFFYVEKLTSLGISEEWISGIILVYSLIEMLAEPIISWGEKVVKTRLFTAFCVLSGLAVVMLGILQNRAVSIIVMCITPLLVSVAEYLIMERENKLIDDLNMHENRATSLSAMNMGVNIVEIAALFLSSMFSLAAVKWCFVLTGSILVIISICIKSYKWNL